MLSLLVAVLLTSVAAGADNARELERAVGTASAASTVASVSAASSVSPAEEGWKQIIDEDGIQVWERKVADSAVVEFRARGRVDAPILHVAAILRNSERSKEWMESCTESRVIEWRSAIGGVIYNRTQSPAFFVSDRDLVAEATTTLVPERKALHVTFKSVTHPKAPPVDGVVRMENTYGHWDLVRVDAKTTLVEYQIHADVGGALPAWLVNWVSERIPFNTLQSLRGQLNRPGYENDEMILDRAIDWAQLDEKRS